MYVYVYIYIYIYICTYACTYLDDILHNLINRSLEIDRMYTCIYIHMLARTWMISCIVSSFVSSVFWGLVTKSGNSRAFLGLTSKDMPSLRFVKHIYIYYMYVCMYVCMFECMYVICYACMSSQARTRLLCVV